MDLATIPELTTPAFKGLTDQCTHCGLCLQACPTYAVTGTEMDGPRGRIQLMRAASEDRISLTEIGASFSQHMELCLECRACESACPSGVKYGQMIETVRIALEHHRHPGRVERVVRWMGLRQAMPHVGRLKAMAALLWLYEACGLQRAVRALGFLPRPLKAMEAILPPIVPKYQDYRHPAPALGPRQGRVAFFVGCIQEAFLAPANQATIRVLQRNGYEVVFPAGQTCCGAAQLHIGEQELARQLARRNIDAFLAEEYDAVITNAGGCGATLKDEYEHLFDGDPQYQARARAFGARVKDISEFLVDHLHEPPTHELRMRVTYADSCHLRHGQKVISQPRQLLRGIPGLELVELKQPDRCCGSAGIYNIVQSPMADMVLDAKMADIAATEAQVIACSNTGCYMQLIAGVRRAGLKAEVKHVVELLDMAYRG